MWYSIIAVIFMIIAWALFVIYYEDFKDWDSFPGIVMLAVIGPFVWPLSLVIGTGVLLGLFLKRKIKEKQEDK